MNLPPLATGPGPTYRKLVNTLASAIADGTYQPGDKLPSGPVLAEGYGIARDTVQHAVHLLRQEGLVTTRPGSGVFVYRRPPAKPEGSTPGPWKVCYGLD